MKRALLVVALCAVALSPVAGHTAPAPKKTTRVVNLSYTLFCGVSTPAASGYACPPETAHFTETATKSEKYVTFTAKDANGTPVGIQYWVNGAYDPGVVTTCGAGKAQNKKGGGTYDFVIALSDTCQGLPTQGTLTVTYSNLP